MGKLSLRYFGPVVWETMLSLKMILRTGYQTVNVGYVRPMLLQWVSLEHQSNVSPSFVIWIQVGFNGNSFRMFLSFHSFTYNFNFIFNVCCIVHCFFVCCALFPCMGGWGEKWAPTVLMCSVICVCSTF